MKAIKEKLKKGTSMLLACTMLAGLVTVMPGNVATVQAADGTQTSVSAYATKDQMMGDMFAPDENGQATNIGKLAFGKNSSRDPQEWYILGKDSGVDEDNTIIFASSPIATNQVFEDDPDNNKTFEANFGVYESESTPSEVYPNHYGASDLRSVLQTMATNTSYFTTGEQGLMNDTTVTTEDTLNKNSEGVSLKYTTTDKLYAVAADDISDSTIKAGSSNQ